MLNVWLPLSFGTRLLPTFRKPGRTFAAALSWFRFIAKKSALSWCSGVNVDVKGFIVTLTGMNSVLSFVLFYSFPSSVFRCFPECPNKDATDCWSSSISLYSFFDVLIDRQFFEVELICHSDKLCEMATSWFCVSVVFFWMTELLVFVRHSVAVTLPAKLVLFWMRRVFCHPCFVFMSW